MKENNSQLHEMAGELLSLLDEEIGLLHIRCRQFDSLYDAILHRDNPALETLLEEMANSQQDQAELDTQLEALRIILAKSLECDPKELKLSMLSDNLDQPLATEVEYKRQQIILLAEKLKRKHLDTALLLSESARINRMLLEGLLPNNETVTTYGVGGASPWRDSTGLVDTEI
ncbi:MAG: flagellar protein FlgN [Phycisphaerae bacterium]|nr:flagellar protein FlgN [Phycisphaerae bacterium]